MWHNHVTIAGKHFKYKDIIETVLDVVHYMCLNGINYQQFINFVEFIELEQAPGDVSLHFSVRWLSISNVLIRFMNLLKSIQLFPPEKMHSFRM